MSQSWQRKLNFRAANFSHHVSDQAVDHGEDVLLLDERHFDVDLSELGLPVRSQVFVPEAAGDLVVAVQATDHQQLLVELRRLRQSVEFARMHAAGNQVIASPFRSALAEHRRFDFQEVQIVEVFSRCLAQLVSQDHRFLQSRSPQIDIPILQTQVFVWDVLAGRLERWRLAFVMDDQFLCPDFYFSGRDVRIDEPLATQTHDAVCLDDVFTAK